MRYGTTVTYQYDNDGALATVTDSETGITTTHYYDFVDRLASYAETGTGLSHQVGYSYDLQNNLTALKETINGTAYTTTYAYDDDNRITSVTGGNAVKTYTYDTLGRSGQQQTKTGGTTVKTDSFTFSPNGTKTTLQIGQHTVTAPGLTKTYSYTYDGNGNILSVSDGTNTTSYVYDSANQLVRENNQAGNFTYTWTYDSAGNILSRQEYAYTAGALGEATDTVAYTYGDSDWGDLLTAYDGNTITHDGMGNPLTDGIWTYTWKHGRELSAMTDGTVTWEYLYNQDGLRTRRTNGTSTYQYVYNGSSLSQMTVGENTLTFFYDAAGTPMSVLYNGTAYFYITNLQGDVTGLLDAAGQPVVAYTYDAWGNSLSITGTMASTLGQLNPLRYRSYVYDEETGLYYLQSRYYDPEVGRFINADGFTSTGQGILGNNMFAYCQGNPVNFQDSAGTRMVAADPLRGGPAGITTLSGLSPTYSPGPSGSLGKKIVNFLTNEDEQTVLDAEYFAFYKGVPVIRTNGDRSGSFGIIFLTRETNDRSNPEDVLRHEYGHTKQLKQLGVINYALCIFLPSWQQWGTGEYYSKPWEITADIYGGVQRNHSQSNIDRGFVYLEGSKIAGPLIWLFIE